MNLDAFENSLSNLTSTIREYGFFKNPNRFEAHVFGKVADFHSELTIITKRIEEDLEEEITSEKHVFNLLKEKKEVSDAEIEKGFNAFMRLMLDLSDFYIYTRIFLDTLTICVKLSFINSGNRNAGIMKHSVNYLLNEENRKTCKNRIDKQFFIGLETHLGWIGNFRKSRDGLVHRQHHFVFTTTRQGERGYEIMDMTKVEWGSDTVRSIRAELQNYVNNLTELVGYLANNLPIKKKED